MKHPDWQGQILNSLRLVACMPLRRGRSLRTNHPKLRQHLPAVDLEAQKMWEEGSVRQINLAAERDLFQCYLIPVDEEQGSFLAFDTSSVKAYLNRYYESLIQAYRDVIYAVTEGRLLLVDPVEASEHVGEPLQEIRHPVRTPEDLGICRTLTTQLMMDTGAPRKQVMEFSLAVSEAITNALKHASGGEFRLVRTAENWTAVIADNGPGIDIALLPHATLLRGYSTKPSLGLGFTAMLRCLDVLVVATSPTGTTLVLQRSHPSKPDPGGDADEQ